MLGVLPTDGLGGVDLGVIGRYSHNRDRSSRSRSRSHCHEVSHKGTYRTHTIHDQ